MTTPLTSSQTPPPTSPKDKELRTLSPKLSFRVIVRKSMSTRDASLWKKKDKRLTTRGFALDEEDEDEELDQFINKHHHLNINANESASEMNNNNNGNETANRSPSLTMSRSHSDESPLNTPTEDDSKFCRAHYFSDSEGDAINGMNNGNKSRTVGPPKRTRTIIKHRDSIVTDSPRGIPSRSQTMSYSVKQDVQDYINPLIGVSVPPMQPEVASRPISTKGSPDTSPSSPIPGSNPTSPNLRRYSGSSFQPIQSFKYTKRKSVIPDPQDDNTELYVLDHDGREIILGGTLQQLINGLTDERADMEYMEEFLYTYSYFTTAEDLLDLLQRRYLYRLPVKDCTPEQMALYEEWRGPVQLRVINCIKKWLENHFYDFEGNDSLLERLKSFIFSVVSLQNEKWAKNLDEIIQRKIVHAIYAGEKVKPRVGLQSVEALAAFLKNSGLVQDRKWRFTKYKQCFVGQEAVDWMMKNMGLTSRQAACDQGQRLIAQDLIVCVSKDKNEFRDTPHSFYQFHRGNLYTNERMDMPLMSPILPKQGSFIHLMTVHPKEIARQLTIIEFSMYKSIQIEEICHQQWNKNGGKESPHVMSMINRFNEVGFWVATEILKTQNFNVRVGVLKKFIKIAHICKKTNNFNTMMEIAVGLNMGAITRLQKTWQAIDAQSRERFDAIMDLTLSTSNYKNYREALKRSQYPILPYLGLHLKDLTFAEDGNPDFLEEGVVNFHKMRMLAKIFANITHYQQSRYNYTPVAPLQQYLLLDVSIEKRDAELYRLSNQCEPSVRNSIRPGALDA